MLALQRAAGNRAVQRLLARDAPSRAPIQAKLAVGGAGDRYEQEAERIAARVVDGKAADRPDGSRTQGLRISRLAAGDRGAGGALPPLVETSILARRGGGHSLSENVRAPMERAFDADFGSVRIHADSHAHALTGALGAHAFTVGQDVFFNRGALDPHSRSGQRLLAHELTHVIQQGSSLALQGSFWSRMSGVYNAARRSVPYLTDWLSNAVAAAATYFTVTSLPVTVPVAATYVIGGVTYGFSENLTASILDLLSVNAPLPTAKATLVGLLDSAASAAIATLPAAVASYLGAHPAWALAGAPIAYAKSLPGMWRGRRRIAKSRDDDAKRSDKDALVPHDPSETVLAFGVHDPKRNLDYITWAEDHGAVTYRYFFTLFDTDWITTLQRITAKADKIYINIGGIQRTGKSGKDHKPTIDDILADVEKYLEQKTVGHGSKTHIVPAHGFTNFEIAFLRKHAAKLNNKLLWWEGNQIVNSPFGERV